MKADLIAVLRARYEYRDGGLYVRYQFNSQVTPGARAGHRLSDGYRQMRVCGGQYREHHLVWLLHTGELPAGEIDHLNFKRDDNRIENLRVVSRRENMQHRGPAAKTSKIGLIGVRKHWNKYRASIVRDGVFRHLGMFDTPEEATAAYMRAQAEHGITLAQKGDVK